MKQVLINHRKLVCQEYVDTSLYVCVATELLLTRHGIFFYRFFFLLFCFFRRRKGSKTKEEKGVMACQRLAVTPMEPFVHSLAKSVGNF